MSAPPLSPSSLARPRVLLLGALVSGALFSLHAGCGGDSTPPESKQIHVQLLAFNDFHGNLEPPTGSNGTLPTAGEDGGTVNVNAGGAAHFAAHIEQLRAQNPNTVVVAAGDLIGASPLVSGIFHDEPTVAVLNQIGLDITSVGNHEFDDGRDELLRMQNGGCHPVDGCQSGESFSGAKFKYLSANVFTNTATRETLLPAYEIREFEGVKVAFIGMTLEGTPGIVNPTGIAGLSFQDEADTVNALVPGLKAQGVEAIVVLIHEGGYPAVKLYDDCQGVSGPILDIVSRLDPEVDFIHSGHTHEAYNCVIDGRRVTSASSFGRAISQVDLVLDTGTKDVVSVEARNHIVTRDAANPTVDTMVKDYVTRAAPLANRVIGQTPVDLKMPPRTTIPTGQSGESLLGNAIADAFLEATRDPDKGGAVIAVTNPGGVRADIPAGNITYGQAFTVQPFSNSVTTVTLTGAQIHEMLEQQFQGANTRILQVSAGFSYSWSVSAPMGKKVDPASIRLNGVPLDPAATYRVTETNYLAAGGDGFSVFTQGQELRTGPIDLDAFAAYLEAHNPLTPPTDKRITVLP
ncbi:bifunctional metallophosphatase/5'-nucleotidase [Cystobacter ferrugineus]|uniref:Bifunctional metallophosphatase/5'-nucleotidase n=2 Tax=Cystobacter TaxID=42 RepID=A0A1L9BJ92_9BACT|nr:bifunctional metallophosphatase/5'-nucleotidase [Cystobacter ferrugineus]AYM53341.1 5'-nucleotidase domain protein [Cystobacter ferrugineus]AYM53396.1 5'-nucleotidase domain protein [Cystobacter velatus]OJH42313.1 bifunctional metallophosphatase/5'-nucleotidase [Cystobacter ferrugineus]